MLEELFFAFICAIAGAIAFVCVLIVMCLLSPEFRKDFLEEWNQK